MTYAVDMGMDSQVEKTIRRFIELISSRYNIDQVILYGSRARGTHHSESDVDVAVLLRGEPERFLPVKLDMADSAYDVSLETNLLISPLPIWTQEWENPEQYSNPLLLENIDREGIRL